MATKFVYSRRKKDREHQLQIFLLLYDIIEYKPTCPFLGASIAKLPIAFVFFFVFFV